jgi:DNA-binding transcriptional ArsR family regulator
MAKDHGGAGVAHNRCNGLPAWFFRIQLMPVLEISRCGDILMQTMASALATLQTTLKLLSDPVRLRLCALLSRAELVVQELGTITGLQQSRISNHLSLLKRAGLVRDRREGTWSFHSLVEPSSMARCRRSLFAATVLPWLESAEGEPDGKALAAVLDQRRKKSREAHDQLADQWATVGQEFAVGTLRAEVLAQAWPCGGIVADLGCGTGFLATWLAERGAHVVAVDHSERMLASARQRGAQDRITFRQGELDALPLRDGEVRSRVCQPRLAPPGRPRCSGARSVPRAGAGRPRGRLRPVAARSRVDARRHG